MNIALDIEPYWRARVEIKHHTGTVRRNIEAPAHDAETAKERMAFALDLVLGNNGRWQFITAPILKGEKE